MAFDPMAMQAPAYQTAAQLAAANVATATAKADVAQAASTQSANATVAPASSTSGAYNPMYGNPLNMTATPTVPTSTALASKGGVPVPGSGTPNPTQPVVTVPPAVDSGKTLAKDTFMQTFGIMFGAAEAKQPYVQDLYNMVSGFYKTGTTIDEAINLSVHKAYNEKSMPTFTARFAGLFALQDALDAGKAVTVPTVSEFFATEAKMGDTLRAAGLGDIATQDFIGNIIGHYKSADEVATEINNAFTAYDNSPQSVKDMMNGTPGMDRVSVAKAMLLGTEGATALQKKVDTAGVKVSAAQSGLGTLTDATAADLAGQGYGYVNSQSKMAAAGQTLPGANILTSIYGSRLGATYGQNQALAEQFGQAGGVTQAQAVQAKNLLNQAEAASFSGSSGTLQSAYGVDRSSFGQKPAGQY